MTNPNLESAMEAIGQAVFEKYGTETPKEVKSLLGLINEAYVLIGWPEVQDLMEEDWFQEEAILDNSEDADSSTYLIPISKVL